jgi:hypothetical protein
MLYAPYDCLVPVGNAGVQRDFTALAEKIPPKTDKGLFSNEGEE